MPAPREVGYTLQRWTLNQIATEKGGTSLAEASSDNYLLFSYLEYSGDINYIYELEAKGYVRTQVVQGLPDGQQRKVKHIRVIPVGDGVELQHRLKELQLEPALLRTQGGSAVQNR